MGSVKKNNEKYFFYRLKIGFGSPMVSHSRCSNKKVICQEFYVMKFLSEQHVPIMSRAGLTSVRATTSAI